MWRHSPPKKRGCQIDVPQSQQTPKREGGVKCTASQVDVLLRQSQQKQKISRRWSQLNELSLVRDLVQRGQFADS